MLRTIWRLRFIAGNLLAALLLCSVIGCKPDSQAAEFLFVQTADSVTFQDDTITLHGVSPTTLFFSDRPDRITGHQDTEMFVENWSTGDDSFASDPPNAALSILGDEDNEIVEVVVELRDPILVAGNLSYTVTVLDGKLPESGGVSALFIDAIIMTDPVVDPAPSFVLPRSHRGQERRAAWRFR
jgi:hypothetical protein